MYDSLILPYFPKARRDRHLLSEFDREFAIQFPILPSPTVHCVLNESVCIGTVPLVARKLQNDIRACLILLWGTKVEH